GPPLGGVFTVTQGLKTTWNSPLDERGIIGAAMGLAMAGQHPVAEIEFCDDIYNNIGVLKLAGNTCSSSYGDWHLQMVLSMASAADRRAAGRLHQWSAGVAAGHRRRGPDRRGEGGARGRAAPARQLRADAAAVREGRRRAGGGRHRRRGDRPAHAVALRLGAD